MGDSGKAGAFVSLHKAAKRIGISRQKVLSECVAGRLRGKEVAGRIVIDESSLAREIARRNRVTTHH